MPRINTQGVTDKRLDDPDVELRQPRENEEDSREWHGKNSSLSGDSKTSDTEKSETRDPKPVRETEPRSTPEKADSNTASSAGGRSRK